MDTSKLQKLTEIYRKAAEKPKSGQNIPCEILDISKADDVTCCTVKLGAPFNATRKIFFLDEE